MPVNFPHNEISCAASLLGALLEVQQKGLRTFFFDPAKSTIGDKNQDGCLYLSPMKAPPYKCALPPVSIQIVKSISKQGSNNEVSLFVGTDFFLQEILPLNYVSKM